MKITSEVFSVWNQDGLHIIISANNIEKPRFNVSKREGEAWLSVAEIRKIALSLQDVANQIEQDKDFKKQ